MCLELFQDLFTCYDLLNLLVYFRFLIPVEYIIHSLMLIINNEDFTFIFARVSALIYDWDVAFYQIKFLQAQQGHIES